ncbi:MAG: YsnF/AvaK domain-containing protein [Acidobacteriaceae bacterium]|nr:YsnF/AvaK domain-containing protein [Acidobacteriaceae bacterium]MBV9223338.1 YsnF/AvaK domain-containing protein [Acidobacteriaceae bacterium]MBV9306486.1 YsnF/AvaK domain-containing protein [Acidobacteriaceae bacterium]
MASTTKSTVIAAFRNSADAQAAAQDLQAAGINRGDIYLESSGSGTSTTSSTSSTDDYSSRTTRHEGGITGWFKSLFGAEEDTDRAGYERAYSEGHYLLSVDADESQIGRIEDILNGHSPVNVHTDDAYTSGSTTGSPNYGTTGTATTAAALGTTGAAGTARTPKTGANTEESIPVVEEELQVGKRRVLRGGVRVYSRVIEQPVEQSVDLQEERVRVDRRPVNRPASDADFRTGKDEVIEVEEFAEQPVIAKQARVVEEVRVGKEVSQRSETVRDTVRRTEVDVEQIPATTGATGTATGAATGAAFDDSDFRRDFQTNYGTSGAAYDTYAPAYRYGYDMASDPRYKGRSFSDVENDLRTDYGRRYPNSTWDKMKNSIRYGWDKVTGRA